MPSPPQRWYCACGANNPPNRPACFRCGAAQAAGARRKVSARGKRRTPKWLAALPLTLATLLLLFVLYRAGSDAASPILAKQGGTSGNVEALPARPELLPAAPNALLAPPEPPKPAPAVPTAPRVSRAPDLPAAPSMLTAPQAPPQVTDAPVVQAPAAPPPPPTPAPSMLAAAEKPEPPQPPVTSAPTRPAEAAPSVTSAQGWKETTIPQERPVVRIYNTAGDEGRSQVFLTDGRSRYRVQVRNPYGEVSLAPGSYRYELYVAGSAAAPDPDQVGVLRCRKFTQYSLEYYRAPFIRTRQQDLGDERPDGS